MYVEVNQVGKDLLNQEHLTGFFGLYDVHV